MSKSSLWEKVGQLKSNKMHLEEQCRLEARSGGRKRNQLNSPIDTKHNLHGNIRELRAQHGQEHADLRYECRSLQAWLATHDSRLETSQESLRAAIERSEAYWSASEICLTSGLGNF